MIPLSIPTIRGNEWEYIKSCLDTNWVSSAGEFVTRFEQDIAQYAGAKYAVSCVNGTAALHISLMLAGVREGDEVIVPTVSFIAPINTVRYLGADPVFMDCDEFYNMDIAKVTRFIEQETVMRDGQTYNKRSGKRISAIVPVHVFGNCVNLEAILPLCQERGIQIIEDATESLGSFYIEGSLKGKYAGTVGDLGCYSFNGNKIITTGGGGMIVTDNSEYDRQARYLTTQAKDDSVRYLHNAIGYNYRMTNIQAAMGVAQLEQLPDYIRAKTENYLAYKREIDALPGLTLAPAPGYAQSNYWFYCLQIDKTLLGIDREALMHLFAQQGIQARPVWVANHLQKPYRSCQAYEISKATELIENTLNIPCSVSLTAEEIELVVLALKSCNVKAVTA